MIGTQKDYRYELCENYTLDDVETIWDGVRISWRSWLQKLSENFSFIQFEQVLFKE